MGIRLVLKVLQLAAARRLSAREITVLGLMAATALDTPNEKGQPAGLYFAGWQHLAINLGWDPDAPKTYERVRRILKTLREKGLITALEDHPRTGTRQCYRITLEAADALLPLDLAGQTSPHVAGSAVPPLTEGGSSPHGLVSSAPTPTGGPRKDLGEVAGHISEDPTHPSAPSTGSAHSGLIAMDAWTGDHATWATTPHEYRAEDDGPCLACQRPELYVMHTRYRIENRRPA